MKTMETGATIGLQSETNNNQNRQCNGHSLQWTVYKNNNVARHSQDFKAHIVAAYYLFQSHFAILYSHFQKHTVLGLLTVADRELLIFTFFRT